MQFFHYYPLEKKFKSETGAGSIGRPVRFYVETDADSCQFMIRKDGETDYEFYPMTPEEGGFSICLSQSEAGLYYYRFSVDGGTMGLYEYDYRAGYDCPDFSWTITDADFSTPDVWKGGVFYQIFPDRFAKKGENPLPEGRVLRSDWGGTPRYKKVNGKVLNNDFFGGNFNGIVEKLDDLQALGVTTIYLNPVFEAASNHRYDTSNYEMLDPLLGTEEDFAGLMRECRERGIRVILDGVFNHTGDDSVYFNKYGRYPSLGAYQSKDSPYYSWYNFIQYPDSYDAWWGIDILPAVDDGKESFRSYITGENGILAKWQQQGVSGWRLDVADELSESFLQDIRKRIKAEDPNALLIGEVWEEADDKIAYGERRHYLQGKELDSVMNYPLKNAIISSLQNSNFSTLYRVLHRLKDRYPKCVLDVLMNSLSTHDTYRIVTALSGIVPEDKDVRADYRMSNAEYEKARSKAMLAAALQFFLPGIPCIYYGDEIGMEGYEDPFSRRCYPLDGKDDALLSFYKKLGAIRRKISLFKDGELEFVREERDLFVFSRTDGLDTVYVAVNIGDGIYDVQFVAPVMELLSEEIASQFTLNRGCVAVFYDKGSEQ